MKVKEPLRVAVVFGPGQSIRPVWFDWRNRKHAILETTYVWTDLKGAVKRLHFSVRDEDGLYQLGRCDEARLTSKFGIVGRRLKQMGQGLDNSPVISCADEGDVKSVGHSRTLERDIHDPAALGILETVELEQPVRLLGISLGNLKHQAAQLPLFEEERKKLFVTQAMDAINDRFGRMAVTFGTLLPGKEKSGSQVIPPSWRSEGIKKLDVQ